MLPVQAIVMEGKYWKRHLDTVTAEYKKWRIYYKNKLNGCDTPPHLSTDELLASFDDMDWLSMGGVSSFDDIESCMDLSDILFTSLMNATEPYAFPNPREIARTGNSDLVQPGLVQLQPDLKDFAYVPSEFCARVK
ncbi:hypothetical protein FHG87_009384 [Trinorchestia longiramus]|nr:hypothetical protein FHG87_009384 [Trinorchestia longiramus]